MSRPVVWCWPQESSWAALSPRHGLRQGRKTKRRKWWKIPASQALCTGVGVRSPREPRTVQKRWSGIHLPHPVCAFVTTHRALTLKDGSTQPQSSPFMQNLTESILLCQVPWDTEVQRSQPIICRTSQTSHSVEPVFKSWSA